MKVDKQEQDDARRERIARAAFELFARNGLEAISAQDIARAAFVSRTNLYRYYPSKMHMLLAHFEKTVQVAREDALERLTAGVHPQQVWEKVTARMADLGVRYQHLVGAVGQAVLSAPPAFLAQPDPNQYGLTTNNKPQPKLPPHPHGEGIRTALTLTALVEPVITAMQAQGHLRPQLNSNLISSLLVDACLLALLHGGHRDQREVLRDWQDRFSLIMHGVLAPDVQLEAGNANIESS